MFAQLQALLAGTLGSTSTEEFQVADSINTLETRVNSVESTQADIYKTPEIKTAAEKARGTNAEFQDLFKDSAKKIETARTKRESEMKAAQGAIDQTYRSQAEKASTLYNQKLAELELNAPVITTFMEDQKRLDAKLKQATTANDKMTTLYTEAMMQRNSGGVIDAVVGDLKAVIRQPHMQDTQAMVQNVYAERGQAAQSFLTSLQTNSLLAEQKYATEIGKQDMMLMQADALYKKVEAGQNLDSKELAATLQEMGIASEVVQSGVRDLQIMGTANGVSASSFNAKLQELNAQSIAHTLGQNYKQAKDKAAWEDSMSNRFKNYADMRGLQDVQDFKVDWATYQQTGKMSSNLQSFMGFLNSATDRTGSVATRLWEKTYNSGTPLSVSERAEAALLGTVVREENMQRTKGWAQANGYWDEGANALKPQVPEEKLKQLQKELIQYSPDATPAQLRQLDVLMQQRIVAANDNITGLIQSGAYAIPDMDVALSAPDFKADMMKGLSAEARAMLDESLARGPQTGIRTEIDKAAPASSLSRNIQAMVSALPLEALKNPQTRAKYAKNTAQVMASYYKSMRKQQANNFPLLERTILPVPDELRSTIGVSTINLENAGDLELMISKQLMMESMTRTIGGQTTLGPMGLPFPRN